MALTSMASEAVGGHITLGLKNSLKEAYFSGPTQMQTFSGTSKLLTSMTSEVIRGHTPEVTVKMTALSRGTGTIPEVTGYCLCGLGCNRT